MIDIIIIILLIIGIIVGFQKGMVEKLWGIFRPVFSYGLALLFHAELAKELVVLLPKYVSISETFLNGAVFDILSRILAFVILFFIIRLALKVMIVVLEAIFSLPLLHSLNKIVGAILGGVEMYFVLFLLFAFLSFFPQQEIQKYMRGSEIVQIMLHETPYISLPYEKLHKSITNPS